MCTPVIHPTTPNRASTTAVDERLAAVLAPEQPAHRTPATRASGATCAPRYASTISSRSRSSTRQSGSITGPFELHGEAHLARRARLREHLVLALDRGGVARRRGEQLVRARASRRCRCRSRRALGEQDEVVADPLEIGQEVARQQHRDALPRRPRPPATRGTRAGPTGRAPRPARRAATARGRLPSASASATCARMPPDNDSTGRSSGMRKLRRRSTRQRLVPHRVHVPRRDRDGRPRSTAGTAALPARGSRSRARNSGSSAGSCARDPCVTGARPAQAGEQAHQRGLARAVGADEPRHPPARNLDRAVAERPELAEALAEVGRLDREVGHAIASAPPPRAASRCTSASIERSSRPAARARSTQRARLRVSVGVRAGWRAGRAAQHERAGARAALARGLRARARGSP